MLRVRDILGLRFMLGLSSVVGLSASKLGCPSRATVPSASFGGGSPDERRMLVRGMTIRSPFMAFLNLAVVGDDAIKRVGERAARRSASRGERFLKTRARDRYNAGMKITHQLRRASSRCK